MTAKHIRGIVVDPHTKTITEGTMRSGLDGIYEAIGAQPMDIIRFGDTVIGFIDDNGLLRANQRFFRLDGFHRVIAGKMFIAGSDADGQTTSLDTSITKKTIALMVRWVSPTEARQLSDDGHFDRSISIDGQPPNRLPFRLPEEND